MGASLPESACCSATKDWPAPQGSVIAIILLGEQCAQTFQVSILLGLLLPSLRTNKPPTKRSDVLLFFLTLHLGHITKDKGQTISKTSQAYGVNLGHICQVCSHPHHLWGYLLQSEVSVSWAPFLFHYHPFSQHPLLSGNKKWDPSLCWSEVITVTPEKT